MNGKGKNTGNISLHHGLYFTPPHPHKWVI
jgi:hypothetical protein